MNGQFTGDRSQGWGRPIRLEPEGLDRDVVTPRLRNTHPYDVEQGFPEAVGQRIITRLIKIICRVRTHERQHIGVMAIVRFRYICQRTI